MAIAPSLAMIPSGYKAQKVYSAVPTNGDGDFDFARSTSATRVNKDGLIEEVAVNVPRLDYSDGGCPSLLLEPSRTNLIQYSEDFSQSYWNKINTGYSTNSLISPNGTLTADKLIPTVGASNKIIYINPFSASVLTYTCSIFAKKGEYEGLLLGTGANGTFFDLDNGTIRANYISAPIDSSIKNYGNGWFKCSITISTSSTNLYIGANDNISTSLSFNADGVGGVYIWGAQLEQGSYATSYIPNFGNSAGATRVAEGSFITNLDTKNIITNSGSWTAFFELELLGNESLVDKIQLSDNSNVPRVYLYGADAGVSGTGWSGGAVLSMNTNNKIIYRGNSTQNISFFENGVNEATLSSASAPITFNRLNLYGANGAFKIKQIQLFKTSLSDAECITLTSL